MPGKKPSDAKSGPSLRRTTLEDVARRAGVSTSAVSRAFTPGASVSKETSKKVLKAARAIGFQPNVLARSLATGRSDMIALVTNAFGNPFINSVVDVFTAELQDRKLLPLVFNLKPGFDWDSAVNLITQYQADGVIIASSTVDERFLDQVFDANIPIIQAFGRYTGPREIDSVFVDNQGGGHRAARELLERGYKKPGFIGAPTTASTTRDRLAGFVEAMAKEGITPVTTLAHGYSHANGYQCALELFAKTPELDSLFCADDLLGIGALDALRFELRRDVPKEVGVIGFNDIAATAWPSHPLATFRADVDQVVVNAIDMLTERIEARRATSEQRIVGTKFVARGSVR